jgi:hypothetical protein
LQETAVILYTSVKGRSLSSYWVVGRKMRNGFEEVVVIKVTRPLLRFSAAGHKKVGKKIAGDGRHHIYFSQGQVPFLLLGCRTKKCVTDSKRSCSQKWAGLFFASGTREKEKPSLYESSEGLYFYSISEGPRTRFEISS